MFRSSLSPKGKKKCWISISRSQHSQWETTLKYFTKKIHFLFPPLWFKYWFSNPKICFQTQLWYLILRHICPIPPPWAFGTLKAMSPDVPASRNIRDKFQAFLSILCQKPDVSKWLYREETTMQKYVLYWELGLTSSFLLGGYTNWANTSFIAIHIGI